MDVQLTIRSALVAVALVALTGACGGDAAEDDGSAGADGTAAPAPSTAAAPPSGAPAPAPEASAPPADATSVPLLEAAVGTEEDPEAFELTLTDSSGAPVETLPAGEYEIRVQDLATLHNLHLTGPGVDETTPIPGTGEVVWRVTFTPGEYAAVCDPHPDMSTSFTVT